AGGQEPFDAAVAAMLDDARGWRLAEMRKRRGLTQEQVASRMGVSVARVSQIERGDVSTQDVLNRFVAALGGTLKLIADFGDEQLKIALSDSSSIGCGRPMPSMHKRMAQRLAGALPGRRTARRRPEDVWQEFFEANPRILNGSRAGQLLASWSDEKRGGERGEGLEGSVGIRRGADRAQFLRDLAGVAAGHRAQRVAHQVTQRCTTVRPNAPVMAASNPASPSQQAIRMSRTPRFFRPAMTARQNPAPSPAVPSPGIVLATQMPSTCFSPSPSMPVAMQAGLFCTAWLSRTLTTIASRNTTASTRP